MIQYVYTRYRFDLKAWALAIGSFMAESGFSHSDMAEILEVSEQTVIAWHQEKYTGSEYPQPSMKSFLKVVNELDLNPQHFWEIRYINSEGEDVTGD